MGPLNNTEGGIIKVSLWALPKYLNMDMEKEISKENIEGIELILTIVL